MAGYRITQGDFQARFHPLGHLTHLGHPRRIKDTPTPFITRGRFCEGNWIVNCGSSDVLFDIETTQRDYDYNTGTLTLTSRFRGAGEWWGLNMLRTYRLVDGLVRCDFTLENWTPQNDTTSQIDASDGAVASAAPIRRLRYLTGVNSYTDYSSDWAHRPYPTNLRCEQDFFWGAAISTAHDVIGYFSETKTDSWRVLYQNTGDQRIESFAIDFINSLDEHPDRLTPQQVRLGRGTPRYSGALYVGRFDSVEALWQKAADVLGVAFLNPKRCSGFVGETLSLDVISRQGAKVTAQITDEPTDLNPSPPMPGTPGFGGILPIEITNNKLTLPLKGDTRRKIIKLISSSGGGKSTEARIWQHTDWNATLGVAARYAADVKVASGYNAETSLAFITLAQAGAYLNDRNCLDAARKHFEHAWKTHFDRATGYQHQHHRLQNYGSFLDAIRVFHRCAGTTEYLDDAHKAARHLMSLQRDDGNFYRHHNIYNNVIHPVKSLYDWGTHLREHGRAADADEVAAAVARAYRSLADAGDDTQTEGGDHYEDGMSSCAGYQIASLWPHFGKRPEDLATAEAIYRKRRMLKSRVPDARLFGGTLRHWELYWAQGLGQGMLAGHGWGAWSASLAHALFMATGDWNYILDAYATVTNCLQSVDLEKKRFDAGFMADQQYADYYGLGTQRPGEAYVPIPAEIRVACESHSVFLTLDDTFYRQTYVRLDGNEMEVLNGRVKRRDEKTVDLETFALEPREIVVVAEGAGVKLPAFMVNGKAGETVVIRRVVAALRERYASGEKDVAARHEEHRL